MSDKNGKVRQRRHLSPAEKATILRRHFLPRCVLGHFDEQTNGRLPALFDDVPSLAASLVTQASPTQT